MRNIEGHIQEAVIAPFNFVGTGNPSAMLASQKASAEALAGFKILGNLLPEVRPHTEATRSALEVLEDASARLWDGHAAIADAETGTSQRIIGALSKARKKPAGVNRSVSILSRKVSGASRRPSNLQPNRLDRAVDWRIGHLLAHRPDRTPPLSSKTNKTKRPI